MIRLLDEFQQIVLMIVSKIVIPILPVFIALTFWSLAYEGTITKQLPVFLKVVLIVMVGHFIWMAVLYAVGGIYSGNNPWKVVKHYGGIHYCSGNDVLCCNACSGFKMCQKVGAGTEG